MSNEVVNTPATPASSGKATSAVTLDEALTLMGSNRPEFVITGHSIEDLCVALAERLLKVPGSLFDVKDNKSNNGNKYAVWGLDDGSSANPYSKGIALSEAQSIRLNTKDGAPIVLSVDVVLRQLTPRQALKAKLAERVVMTNNRESQLEAQLQAIRERKARELARQ